MIRIIAYEHALIAKLFVCYDMARCIHFICNTNSFIHSNIYRELSLFMENTERRHRRFCPWRTHSSHFKHNISCSFFYTRSEICLRNTGGSGKLLTSLSCFKVLAITNLHLSSNDKYRQLWCLTSSSVSSAVELIKGNSGSPISFKPRKAVPKHCPFL